MTKRRLLWVFAIIAAPFVLIVVFLLVEHIRGGVALAKYQRYLRAHGEPLSASDIRPAATAADNATPELMAATRDLIEGKVLPANFPPRMRLTPSGNAVVCFRENAWVQDKATNDWDQLFADLQTNSATLARISKTLEKSYFDNSLDYSQGPFIRLPHLLPMKRLAGWYGSEAQLALHDSRLNDALTALVSELHLPRTIANDRILISELVRIAIALIARSDTWEALQADGWNEAQLAVLQSAWESNQYASNTAAALGFERVDGLFLYNATRRSNQIAEVNSVWLDPPGMENIGGNDVNHGFLWGIGRFFKIQVYARVWRFAWFDQNEVRYLQQMQQLIEIARETATRGSYKGIKATVDRIEAEAKPTSWYDRCRYGNAEAILAVTRSVLKSVKAETERSLVACVIALKRFALQHGNAPKTLEELVPDFLSAVPIDYMDGQPLRYRVLPAQKFRLYSVGEDGVDDGGDLSLQTGKTNLKDLWQRKDFVWPEPASPEELQAYRANQRKP